MKRFSNAIALAVSIVVVAPPLSAQPAARATEMEVVTTPVLAGTITGTITDKSSGQPLAGVQIGIVGTTLGVTTDNAGKYRLGAVEAGTVQLRVRFIGYVPIDRSVMVADGSTVTVDFAMETKPLSLDAMVVTGTAGGTKAREVGNALAVVSPTKLVDAPVASVQQMIGQRAPSVVVLPVAGNVGSGSAISIRGAASLSLQTQPIIYVDGVRVDNSAAEGPAIRQGRSASRLNDFNPEDIESMEIIKGPAAATLYGTEASNGVIQIITKRGKAGKAHLDIAYKQGGNYMADKRGKLGLVYGMDPTTQQVDSFSVFDLYKKQYDGKELFTMGPISGINAAVSGGTDATHYFASAEHQNTQGIVDYNWQNATSARVNLSLLPSPTWKVNANLNYNQSNTRFAQAADQFGIWEMMIWASPTLLNTDTKGWRYATPAVAASVDSRSGVQRFTAGFDVTNTPWDWFTQQIKAGVDVSAITNQILFPRVPNGAVNLQGARSGGQKTLENVTTPYHTLDYSATARKDIWFGTSTATSFGAQYYRRQTTTVSAVGSNFPTTDITTIGGAASSTAGETFVENKTLGFYVQEAFGWQNRRFITAAVRGDANSAFGADYAAAYYPKLSGAWVVSEEPFFEDHRLTRPIGTLRLRASWGQAGQQPDAFAALRLYTPTTGPGGRPATTPLSIGNPKLRPERGSELDFGFDVSSKDDAVSLEYTHYSRKTTDAIVNVPVQPSTGFGGNQIVNLGKTSNWGDEIGGNFRILAGDRLGWDLTTTYATTHNMVNDLGGVTLQNFRVGYPVTSIFMTRVVQAEFINNKLSNVMCDGGPDSAPVTCDIAPTVYWGVGQPTRTASISNTVTLFQRLRLFATVDGQFGSHSVDGDIRDANTNFQNTAKIWTSAPDPIFAAYQTVAPKAPLGFYDASFIKLRELSATYTASSALASRVGASGVSLTGSWRNVALLWRATKYVNSVIVPDPEVRSPGLGNNYTYQTTLPPTSMFLITARLSY
jgi:TonB-linked SusC/RagA family outer membrane protein